MSRLRHARGGAALLGAALLGITFLGDAPLLGTAASGEPSALVHVRVALSNVWVEGTLLGPGGPGPESSNDWIFDATLEATDDALEPLCRAQARSMHSRFMEPFAVDFHLRFLPSQADCLHAEYEAVLFGYGHTSLKDIDFRGEGDGRAARIRFHLTDPPKTGSVNGTHDGNRLEVDGSFDYEVRVLRSTLPLPPQAAVPELTPWLVRLDLYGMRTVNPGTIMGNDWFLDAEVRPVGGEGPACKAQERSMHARFFTPRFLDLWVLDPGGCEGRLFQLRLVAWSHLDDALFDLDPTAGEELCQAIPFPKGDVATMCDHLMPFPLEDGFRLREVVADGTQDHAPSALEYDAVLRYSLQVRKAPATSTFQLDVDHGFTGLNQLRLLHLLESWNLDVQAAGEGDCVAQKRNSHDHYFRHTVVDLSFVGSSCLDAPVRVDFAAYWTTDVLLDIDPRTLEQGGSPCPDLSPAYLTFYYAPLMRPVEQALQAGCLTSFVWDPRAGPAWGTVDGWDDGFSDLTDARLSWTIVET